MSWTLTTSGAAIAKAGYGANSDIIASAATLAKYSDDAEGLLNVATRRDWIADYAIITANFKPILSDVVSDLIAMRIISYDMGGYVNLNEAQTILNVLKDTSTRSIEILKEQKNQEKMS